MDDIYYSVSVDFNANPQYVKIRWRNSSCFAFSSESFRVGRRVVSILGRKLATCSHVAWPSFCQMSRFGRIPKTTPVSGHFAPVFQQFDWPPRFILSRRYAAALGQFDFIQSKSVNFIDVELNRSVLPIHDEKSVSIMEDTFLGCPAKSRTTSAAQWFSVVIVFCGSLKFLVKLKVILQGHNLCHGRRLYARQIPSQRQEELVYVLPAMIWKMVAWVNSALLRTAWISRRAGVATVSHHRSRAKSLSSHVNCFFEPHHFS